MKSLVEQFGIAYKANYQTCAVKENEREVDDYLDKMMKQLKKLELTLLRVNTLSKELTRKLNSILKQYTYVKGVEKDYIRSNDGFQLDEVRSRMRTLIHHY